MHPILKEVLLDIERLEPFPEVAVRVLELSLQEDLGPREIVEVIQTDAGITAKVLKLANSALQGARTAIASVEQAGVHLGEKALLSMVMTSASQSFFMGLGASTPRSNHSLWEESVANGVAARLLARHAGHPDPEVAYTVGLLQNLGLIVLDRFLARERDEILGHVDTGMGMLQAERLHLGLSHAQIGARLARRWKFPSVLIDAILHHHTPHLAVIDPKLCAVTNLAEGVTWRILGEEGVSALTYGVSGQTLRLVKMDQAELPKIGHEVVAELQRQRDVIGTAPPKRRAG
ncbi:MAG: HDOD domain-containing protein [Planctomycetota bacterium]